MDDGSISSLSASQDKLGHLVLVIEGPGAPGMLEFDAKEKAIESTVSVSVPGGTYKIRVGAYVKNYMLGDYFAYGEASVNSNGGTQEVRVNVAKIAASSGLEGRVMGLYQISGAPAPTGRVTGYVTLPGKEPMPIVRKDIFAGWFNFFVIDGIDFKYVTDSGVTLFNSLKIDSTGAEPEILVNGISLAGSPEMSVQQLYKPQHYDYDTYYGGPSDELHDKALLMYGYFMDGAPDPDPNKQACVEPDEPVGTYNSGSMSKFLHPLTATPTAMDWDWDVFDDTMFSRVGMAGSGTDCTAGAEFSEYLSFKNDEFKTQGYHAGLPINDLTRNTWSGRFGIGSTGVPGQLRVAFATLPGVWSDETTGGIDGVDVYATSTPSTDLADPIPGCEKASTFGWIYRGSIVHGGTAAAGCEGDDTCALNIDGIHTSTQDALAIGCPYRLSGTTKKYFNTVFEANYARWNLTSAYISVDMASGSSDIWVLPSAAADGVDNCRLVNGTFTGTPNFTNVVQLKDNGSTAQYTLHRANDTNCTQTPITTLTVQSGVPGPVQFRVKASTAGRIKIKPKEISYTPTAAKNRVNWAPFEIGSGYELQLTGATTTQNNCGIASEVTLLRAVSGSTQTNPYVSPIAFSVDQDPSGWILCPTFTDLSIAVGQTSREFKYSGSFTGQANISIDTTAYPDIRIHPDASAITVNPP